MPFKHLEFCEVQIDAFPPPKRGPRCTVGLPSFTWPLGVEADIIDAP